MSYGNGKADIESCWLADAAGRRINVVEAGTPFRWCYRVKFNEDIDKPIFAMMLKTREGVALYGVDSTQLDMEISPGRVGDNVEVQFALTNTLAPGVYYLNCGVRIHTNNGVEFLSRRIDSAILRVTAGPQSTVAAGLIEMGAAMSLSRTV
ncbi:MAG: Wzt carbohydrate-binding domain-containing protein [Methylobacter sp.]|nr:Wzt carbohydrate-binding domain-containing protein [Methylobacter sp.]